MKKTILTAILTLSSTSLFATTIQHTGLDSSRAMNIEIGADGSVRSVGAGVGRLLVDGLNTIDAFCVNLFRGIALFQNYQGVTVDADAFDLDGSSAAWLMQTYLPVVNLAAGVERQIDGAALQLAIWDTIHDGGDGFAAGRVRSTGNTNSSVIALANQWRLEALDQNGSAGVYTAAPGARAFQQQMYLPPTGGDVPEPSTWAMLGIGGLAMAFGSWRRKAGPVE